MGVLAITLALVHLYWHGAHGAVDGAGWGSEHCNLVFGAASCVWCWGLKPWWSPKGAVLRQIQLLCRWGVYPPLLHVTYGILWSSASLPLLEFSPFLTLNFPWRGIRAPLFEYCFECLSRLYVPLHAHKGEGGKTKISPSIPWSSDICLIFLISWLCHFLIYFTGCIGAFIASSIWIKWKLLDISY